MFSAISLLDSIFFQSLLVAGKSIPFQLDLFINYISLILDILSG